MNFNNFTIKAQETANHRASTLDGGNTESW